VELLPAQAELLLTAHLHSRLSVASDLALHHDQRATSKSQYKGTGAHNAPVHVVRRHMRRKVKGDEEERGHIRRKVKGYE
jgi:hypothetical protein